MVDHHEMQMARMTALPDGLSVPLPDGAASSPVVEQYPSVGLIPVIDTSSSVHPGGTQPEPSSTRFPSVHFAAGNGAPPEVQIEMADRDKPLGTEDLIVAGTLLKDAKSNRFINFKNDGQSVRSYNLYHHKVLVLGQHMFLIILLAIALLERPAAFSICSNSLTHWCPVVTMSVELLCLVYFAFRVLHYMSFQEQRQFWQDKKNVAMVIILGLTVLDMVAFLVWSHFSEAPIRITRILRPLIITNFPQSRQIRRAFRNIRRTLIEIVFVLILFFASLLFFALLGFKLFASRKLGTNGPYFEDYFESLWRLYVLVTTANNPDVMMPAYNHSSWYFIYFFIFLVVNLYVFMNILLAVIFNSYKKNMKNEVIATVYAKRQKLSKAFDVLKSFYRGSYSVSPVRWHQVLAFADPSTSIAKRDLLFKVLDDNGDGRLSKSDFLKVGDLLNVPLTEVKDRMNLFEKYAAGCYMSSFSTQLRLCILHRYFRYFFDLAIVVNAVFISIDMQDAEWFFLVLFSVEILLKVYAYGFAKFIKTFWNLFDCFVIGGAFIATVAAFSVGDTDVEENEILNLILVLRVLRLVKLINGVKRFRVIMMTIVNIAPSILTYGGVLFVIYYMFAIVGMELFQGRIVSGEPHCGSKYLNGTNAFVADNYCKNNFNDLLSSLVVLVELTVVNQWHVIAEGFVSVTTEWAKLFFVFFHMSAVVIVMNIFIAFILEAFILEYSLSKGKFDSVIEKKIRELGYNLGHKHKDEIRVDVRQRSQSKTGILVEEMDMGTGKPDTGKPEVTMTSPKTASAGDGAMRIGNEEDDEEPTIHHENGLRFHLSTGGRKKVEVLLQRMFEGEIDPEDVGPDLPDLESYDSEEINHARATRKLTLDRVFN